MRPALAVLLFSIALQASDVTNGNFRAAAPGTEKPRPKSQTKTTSTRKTYPFYGVLDSTTSGSIVLKGKSKNRTILITSDTRIDRNGASAKLSDAKAGDKVTGTVQKNGAGNEEAVRIHFGERTEISTRK
jgi:hypothetical protein